MTYPIYIKPEIPTDIVNRIAQIDLFKGHWQGYRLRFPTVKLQKLQREAFIASIGSSLRLSGIQMTNSAIETILTDWRSGSPSTDIDAKTVTGYADALDLIWETSRNFAVIENNIMQLHGLLFKNTADSGFIKGKYKSKPNTMAIDTCMVKETETATPQETPEFMRCLFEWYNQETNIRAFHPLIVTGTFIIHFLRIHPFQDGNCRMSRLLTTLLLLHAGYDFISYHPLETIMESCPRQFYLALRRSQNSNMSHTVNMEEWLRYFVKIMHKQIVVLQEKLNLPEDTSPKVSPQELPILSETIIHLFPGGKKHAISEIVSMTGANRNTVKKHLHLLVEQGMLHKHGTGKGTWYTE